MKHVFGIRIGLDFAAAHHLRGYEGDCARPHGHNYKVEVEAQTNGLNPIGIAVDFKDLKKELKTLVDKYDHQDINLIPPFTDINPTAETLAQHFFIELEQRLQKNPATVMLTLKRVTIWETDRCSASYGFEA